MTLSWQHTEKLPPEPTPLPFPRPLLVWGRDGPNEAQQGSRRDRFSAQASSGRCGKGRPARRTLRRTQLGLGSSLEWKSVFIPWMDPTPPRQSRQGAAQAGLRQYIQVNLPNCLDQNCFYLPRHRSLGYLVLPTSFDPSFLARPPPAVCHRYPRLNARIASRAPGLSAFLT